ncbi:MAG: ROK family protein [Clostridia bacterium]|nr:ROK family protein [Clostridia bacterium]
MKNSSDIRKDNKKSIYRLMLDGKQYTKQQVALGTRLSVATCNTLLNDMQAQGIVDGEKKQLGEVGRSSVLYQIQETHESYLAILFNVEHGNKVIKSIVFSALGRILFQENTICETILYEQIEQLVLQMLEKYPNINRIIIGTPSITENGIMKHSDIPELENMELKTNLEQRFDLAVSMENDMHHMAYGYCKKTNTEDHIITLAYYPAHLLPGTVTIYKGKILHGANHIAGMVGFLPTEVSRKEQIKMYEPETCIPLIAKSMSAIIALLNPDTIVMTGDLIDEQTLSAVNEILSANIPPDYIPQFLIVDDFDEYYYEGLYQLAVERKEI